MVPGLANLGPGSHTSDVGSYPVDLSPFGAADMAGNVREWVADDAPGGKKTVRGGAFDFPADQFTVTWKGARLPGADAGNSWPVGFRCAK
jgi:formylglycine-generating enzyme required for sulfatase activity